MRVQVPAPPKRYDAAEFKRAYEEAMAELDALSKTVFPDDEVRGCAERLAEVPCVRWRE